jgi:hypothetical protein
VDKDDWGGKNDDGGPKPMIGVQSDGGQVLNDDGRAKRQQAVYNDDWGGQNRRWGVYNDWGGQKPRWGAYNDDEGGQKRRQGSKSGGGQS